MFTNEAICAVIRSEIVNNNQYYQRFFSGEIEEMLQTLDKYLKKGIYGQQIVDIVVLAVAKSLSVNLCIYKKFVHLYMQPSNPPSSHDVYLCYNNEHYDAIVCKHTPLSLTCDKSTTDDTPHKAQFNPNITLLDRSKQEYLNSLGIEIEEKDLGPEVSLDGMKNIYSNNTSNMDTQSIYDDQSNSCEMRSDETI